MERQVHQMARLKRQLGLRLQAPFWLQNSPGIVPPKGWRMNSPRADLSCRDPVTLLREHVVDACLATPTQIPNNRDDLYIIELHNRPIELTLLNQNNQSESDLADGFQLSLEQGNLELKLMTFLPASCRELSQQWFQEMMTINQPERLTTTVLQQSMHSGETFLMAYLTPEMRMAQPLPGLKLPHFKPYSYTEHLVLLTQHANEPAMLTLIESIEHQIGR